MSFTVDFFRTKASDTQTVEYKIYGIRMDSLKQIPYRETVTIHEKNNDFSLKKG